jgi:hypothetical protein
VVALTVFAFIAGAATAYRLAELPKAERHLLTLELAPGAAGYAFTFG